MGMYRNLAQSQILNFQLVAAAAQSFFYGAFTTGVFSACQSTGVVGVSAGVTAIMTAAGGAGAAGIATALETRKVYEEEIEKFSIHFKTDHRSVLHVKYGLKQLELSKSEISKTEWTLNISAENSFAWIIELDNGNQIQIEGLNSGTGEIKIPSFEEIRIRKIYVLKKKNFHGFRKIIDRRLKLLHAHVTFYCAHATRSVHFYFTRFFVVTEWTCKVGGQRLYKLIFGGRLSSGPTSSHSGLLDNRNRTQKWDESPC